VKTFNETVTDYTTLSRDNSTANSTLGKSLINIFIKKILIARDWTFNRGSFTDKSVAAQQNYPKSYNCWRIREIKVKVGNLYYFPKEVTSREVWTNLNRTVVTSDAASKFFVEPDHVEIYPVPATNDNDIISYFQKLILSLSATDYVTGTVSVSAGGTAVTGSGTTFTAAMVGRFIKFTDDGYWYEISAFTDTTHITIKREARVAISGGAYTISELIPLPFGFGDIPLWSALAMYFQSIEEPSQAREYQNMALKGLEELLRRDAKTTGNVLTKSDIESFIDLVDPNKYPQDIS